MATEAVVELVVDASRAERDIESQLRDIVRDAERGAPTINVDAQTDEDAETDIISGLLRSIRSAERQSPPVRLDAEVTDDVVSGQIRDIVRRAEQGSPTIDLDVDVDISSLAGVSDALDDVAESSGEAADETDRIGSALARVDSFAGSVGRIGGLIGGAGVAAAGTAKLAAGLVVSLNNIAPAAAVGVTSLLTITAATATLKLGLSGVQDALSQVFATEPDAAALAKAMENLSPAAREFVTELQGMRPAFDALRLDVQERIFTGFADRLKELSPVGSTVRKTMQEMADSFNAVGNGVIDAATEVGEDGSLGQALASSTAGMRTLEQIPAQILKSLVRLAAAGGPLFERFANRISLAVGNISQRIERSFKSGALEDAVNKAGTALAQLGRVFINVGGILNNVFGTLATSGAGLFGILESLTQSLKDATATQGFQDAMVALSSVFEALATVTGPLLSTVLGILADVVTTIAPPIENLINVLGPELQRVFTELQPSVQQVAVIFGQLVDAIAPLLPQIADVLISAFPILERALIAVSKALELILPPIVKSIGILLEFAAVIIDTVVFAFDALGTAAAAIVKLFQGDVKGALRITEGLFRKWGLNVLDVMHVLTFGISRFVFDIVQSLTKGSSDAGTNFLVNIRNKLNSALDSIRSLPSRAKAALGDLGSTLFPSGSALMRGFVEGIRSQLDEIAGAVSDNMAEARKYLPFSPAKKGPFSGKGWTLYSGQAVMRDFVRGIEQERGKVSAALSRTLRGEPRLGGGPGAMLASGVSPALSAPSPFLLGPASVGMPNVAVYIGNERLNGFVDARIDGRNSVRDRQAAQGARF